MKKTKIRLTVGKEYANYFLSITITFQEKKVVKVGLKNIFTSYYQITEISKSVLSIRQHAESKDDRKQKLWTTGKRFPLAAVKISGNKLQTFLELLAPKQKRQFSTFARYRMILFRSV